MQHNCFGITDKNAQRISYEYYNSSGSNGTYLDKMRQIVSLAIQGELTQRQRECIVMYYYENMKMYEIASLLSLSPSTVTRHIKAAQRKLRNLAQYY